MKRALLAFAVVAGVAVLAAGVPSMAADGQPEGRRHSLGDDSPFGVHLNSTDQPTTATHQRAKPKRDRTPGRMDMSGLNVFCVESGLLSDLFGFAEFGAGCSSDDEKSPRLRFPF